jgi:hypothetical protein
MIGSPSELRNKQGISFESGLNPSQAHDFKSSSSDNRYKYPYTH